MLNQKLNKQDKQLVKTLSQANSKHDKYIILLKNEYGFSLSKTNLAQVLNCSEQTLDRRIKEAMNIPSYIRSGSGHKSNYLFPVIEVSAYLCNTIKVR